ncbi:MAG TPA: hypothetical protein VFK21_00555 [Gammaproteobacteria bacterium]|nr:hypothetical protein [Gammaproteobacteria bacterium]
MTRHPFNGNIEGKKGVTSTLHYQGIVEIVEDRKAGRFHASYGIYLHNGRGHRTSEEKRVTVVGEFNTEQEALQTALEQAGKYFR